MRHGVRDPILVDSRDFGNGWRFWQGEDDQIGRLVYKPKGVEHARGLFGYHTETWMDDQSGYRFGAHNFAPGEYVSIHDDSGKLHTFK